jgi:hypothetical protein
MYVVFVYKYEVPAYIVLAGISDQDTQCGAVSVLFKKISRLCFKLKDAALRVLTCAAETLNPKPETLNPKP